MSYNMSVFCSILDFKHNYDITPTNNDQYWNDRSILKYD